MRSLGDWLRISEIGLRTLGRGVRLYTRNGSWRAWAQVASYYPGKLRGRDIPLSVCLAVTYKCQCACANCYAAARQREKIEELSTAETKKLIDEVQAVGAIHLNFTGGEPLLREDLLDLIAHAHARGLITRISTNGYLLTRERVAALRRAGLNQCGIAIDDADPKTHDQLRALPGLFERAILGFCLLHEFGIESRLVTYACHDNMPQGMEPILDMAGRLRIKLVHINFPYASGLWAESSDEMFSRDDMDRLRKFQRSMRSPLVLFEFPSPRSKCLVAKKSFVYISSSGDVTPCPVVPYGLGNVRQESFVSIWKRHTDLLRFDYRGNCPVNEPAGREALRAHAASVAARHQG